MGERLVRDLDLFAMFRAASWFGRTSKVFPSPVLQSPRHHLSYSFVRSASMDKWKTIELEKMKVGGNRKWLDFLEDHDDFNPSWSIDERYNAKSAALYRDKISTEAQGEVYTSPFVIMVLTISSRCGPKQIHLRKTML